MSRYSQREKSINVKLTSSSRFFSIFREIPPRSDSPTCQVHWRQPGRHFRREFQNKRSLTTYLHLHWRSLFLSSFFCFMAVTNSVEVHYHHLQCWSVNLSYLANKKAYTEAFYNILQSWNKNHCFASHKWVLSLGCKILSQVKVLNFVFLVLNKPAILKHLIRNNAFLNVYLLISNKRYNFLDKTHQVCYFWAECFMFSRVFLFECDNLRFHQLFDCCSVFIF